MTDEQTERLEVAYEIIYLDKKQGSLFKIEEDALIQKINAILSRRDELMTKRALESPQAAKALALAEKRGAVEAWDGASRLVQLASSAHLSKKGDANQNQRMQEYRQKLFDIMRGKVETIEREIKAIEAQGLGDMLSNDSNSSAKLTTQSAKKPTTEMEARK